MDLSVPGGRLMTRSSGWTPLLGKHSAPTSVASSSLGVSLKEPVKPVLIPATIFLSGNLLIKPCLTMIHFNPKCVYTWLNMFLIFLYLSLPTLWSAPIPTSSEPATVNLEADTDPCAQISVYMTPN